MKQGDLTARSSAATTSHMQGSAKRLATGGKAAIVLTSLMLAGCITVNAPEEPIVIELNINIRQEVIYRLAEDAGNTIDENADIF